LASSDFDGSVLGLERSLEDDDLAGFKIGFGLRDEVLNFLRHLGAERRNRHAAIGDAAAQEDRFPGTVQHGGREPGQFIAKGEARAADPILGRELLGGEILVADGIGAARFRREMTVEGESTHVTTSTPD
jgi:hypothetical protein